MRQVFPWKISFHSDENHRRNYDLRIKLPLSHSNLHRHGSQAMSRSSRLEFCHKNFQIQITKEKFFTTSKLKVSWCAGGHAPCLLPCHHAIKQASWGAMRPTGSDKQWRESEEGNHGCPCRSFLFYCKTLLTTCCFSFLRNFELGFCHLLAEYSIILSYRYQTDR